MTTHKSKTTLFISDLHLEATRPDITQTLLAFLRNQAEDAEALYILGDFFNVWIGDDDSNALNQQIASALKELNNSGTEIFLMHGNRDFLLGEAFAKQAGATLIEQPIVRNIYNIPLLLLHGDSLCTKDLEYMKIRAMFRSPAWQAGFLAKPLTERKAFAEQARQQSKAMNSNKAEDIMDVTEAEVSTLLAEHQVHTMIHGHTHRPAVHDFSVQGENAQRIVLGDWDQHLWYLELSDEPVDNAQAGLQQLLKSTLEPKLALKSIALDHHR